MSPDPRYHDEMLEQPRGWDIERCPECDEPVGECEHTSNVREEGHDLRGEVRYDDDLGPLTRTDGNVTTHGFDKLPPIGGSKWSSRYASEKTGGVFSDALMHPQIADVAQGIGHGVTNVLHGLGDTAGYVRDAITFHTDPTKDPKILEHVKNLRDQAGLYDPASWDATSRLQKANDLLGNAREHNWARDAVGVGLHGLNALLLKTQIPKALERFRPTLPHRDLSEIQEK